MRSYQRQASRSTRRRRVNPCAAAVFGLLAGGLAGLLIGLPLEPAGANTDGFEQAPVATQHPRGVPPSDNGFRNIGAAACRTCHRELYAAWETSPHGRAAAVLSFEQTLDPECAPCHLPDEGVLDNGVGCEACHGPGSAYAELDVMIDPLKRTGAGLRDAGESCAFCHNPGHPFHVERDLAAAATTIHRR